MHRLPRLGLRLMASAAGCAVTAVTAMTAAGPACAATYTHNDPAHDAQQINAHGRSSHAKTNKTADIVFTRVEHTRTTVRTVVHVRRIGDRWTYTAQLHTPDRTFTIVGQRRSGSTTFHLASTGTTTCAGLRDRVVAAKQKISVLIPTSCLGKPPWVREGVAMLVPQSDSVTIVDDGLRRLGWNRQLHLSLSPRLGTRPGR
jgi:hypothetical protein